MSKKHKPTKKPERKRKAPVPQVPPVRRVPRHVPPEPLPPVEKPAPIFVPNMLAPEPKPAPTFEPHYEDVSDPPAMRRSRKLCAAGALFVAVCLVVLALSLQNKRPTPEPPPVAETTTPPVVVEAPPQDEHPAPVAVEPEPCDACSVQEPPPAVETPAPPPDETSPAPVDATPEPPRAKPDHEAERLNRKELREMKRYEREHNGELQ